MSRQIPDPLPAEWLPDPVASRVEDDPEAWERRLRSLMKAAERALGRYRRVEPGWWMMLGQYWQPTAVALAAAAVLAVVLGLGRTTHTGAPQADMTLAAAVTGGQPAALWTAMGADADPVLALIALEGESK